MARPKEYDRVWIEEIRASKRPELLGLAEVAELLGVTTRTASRYSAREGFPTPVALLKAGPIWERPDVERWAKAEQHKPTNGRRKR